MVAPERIQQYIEVKPEGTDEQKILYAKSIPSSQSLSPLHESELHYEESDNESVDPLLHTTSEGLSIQHKAIDPPMTWPSSGSLQFDHVWFRYQPEGDLVLRGLNFKISAGEKIGIVGRTGAGKSSLAMCLFRIAELHRGRVIIDGIDVSRISLMRLRSALQIVPQSPVLFRGSLRAYLDPFGEYCDAEMWEALEKAQLIETVQNMTTTSSDGKTVLKGLDAELCEGGDNLSVGQRQMVVLARAMLRKAKILLMDEATAAIDGQTDKQLHDVLKEQFKDSTVLTIAHRIGSIMECDRVMVLSAGRVVELDSPNKLLKDKNGKFYALALEAGCLSDEQIINKNDKEIEHESDYSVADATDP
eukprot:CAMPEP_0182424284 /NCGR_PEP_ID=MMETSP1167-20130531/10453_1 /TAXON_ID=2988 /ORGANISM="Mallomonas Sp, Strain CCMP3275" /LENGTH=359 /DNA_ID=CAMNT_0024603957 /DNA_START=637 /DNA_END=1716 /DNA_ORIENTATION=+